jgi:retron-type reverse transcriptase
MSIWISQHSIEESKKNAYRRVKDERIFWLNPFKLVSFIAGDKKTKTKIDETLSKFRSDGCSAGDMASLFRIFNTWGKKFGHEITLRVIAKPEDKVFLENIQYIRNAYYKNREKDPLGRVPKLNCWIDKFTGDMRKYYRRFKIPKRNGSKRIINAPVEELASVQRSVLKKILYPNYPNVRTNPAHGFLPGKNILSNAQVHSNSIVIVNLDLKDAFTSTKEDNLFPGLQQFFTKKGAEILIKLCCLKGCLPQGAPTSPMLLNFVLLKMDEKVNAIAKNTGWRYSRYADDLTFSCLEKDNHTIGVGKLIKEIVGNIVKESGYRLNKKKIRVFRPRRAMKVTGLTLNSGEPTISRKFRRIVRAKVHNFVTKGVGNIKNISGYISYISLVHKEYAEKLKEKLLNPS